MAQAHAHPQDAARYYIPHGSPWPIVGSMALFTLMLGAIAFLNDWTPAWSLVPRFAALPWMFIGWFRVVIDENQRGILDNPQVDRSFRMGMMWFIFSEV